MRIALSGYYGCGNTGDEAVLAGIVESFARRAPGQADLTVLSADPADTGRRHGLRAVNRMNPGALRGTLRESDLLISGGGSLLQDTTSMRSLVYYLWVARLAGFLGTPVMFYAQGIGPLRRRAARLLTRIVANRAAAITVRDAASADLLRSIGVRRPPIEVTADPAFALTPEPRERALERIQAAGADVSRPLVGIALRPWLEPGPGMAEYARMAQLAASAAGGQAVFLPMQPPGDLELAEQVAASVPGATVVREELSPAAAVGIVGALSGLVAMRLHALIFGAMGGVPLVALGYDPKVRSLMADLGQPGRCLDLAGLQPESVAKALETALGEGEALCERLRCAASMNAEKTLANVDRALAAARLDR